MNLDRKFYQCLGAFDFDKVQKVMELLDWKWSFTDGTAFRVPEKNDMVDMLLKLWEDNKATFESRVIDSVSTGGFTIEAGVDIDKGFVRIFFIAEQQEN